MLQYKEQPYLNYGKALCIQHENMELIVTTDIGPRILFFGEAGGANLLFNDTERENLNNSERLQSVFGEGEVYYFYGGHRVWASPENDPNSMCPDNEPVEVVFGGQSVTFRAKPQKVTGLQLSMEVTPVAGGFKITSGVTNLSEGTKTLAAWGITQLAPGGHMIIPQVTENTGLLPNRTISVWAYTDLRDERVRFGQKYIVARQNPKVTQPLKFGINNEAGYLVYVNGGYAFIKTFDWENGKLYPDNNVNCECYIDGALIEGECLTYKKLLKTGESSRVSEVWRLKKTDTQLDFGNEASLEAFLSKIIIDE